MSALGYYCNKTDMLHAFDGAAMPANMTSNNTHVGQQEGQWLVTQPPRTTADIRERGLSLIRNSVPVANVATSAAAAIGPHFVHREDTRRELFVESPWATEILPTTLAQRRIPARTAVHVVVPPARIFDALAPCKQPSVDMEQRSFQQKMSAQVATRQKWEADTAHARVSDDRQ